MLFAIGFLSGILLCVFTAIITKKEKVPKTIKKLVSNEEKKEEKAYVVDTFNIADLIQESYDEDTTDRE